MANFQNANFSGPEENQTNSLHPGNKYRGTDLEWKESKKRIQWHNRNCKVRAFRDTEARIEGWQKLEKNNVLRAPDENLPFDSTLCRKALIKHLFLRLLCHDWGCVHQIEHGSKQRLRYLLQEYVLQCSVAGTTCVCKQNYFAARNYRITALCCLLTVGTKVKWMIPKCMGLLKDKLNQGPQCRTVKTLVSLGAMLTQTYQRTPLSPL